MFEEIDLKVAEVQPSTTESWAHTLHCYTGSCVGSTGPYLCC